VNAEGTIAIDNKILKTSLISYYHPKYGFIRIEYTNVDGTRLIFELIEVKN